MAAAKQLYQLVSKTKLAPGAYVAVNGPWDTYGVVQCSEPHPNGFINLIRGCEKKPSEKPVASF